MEPLLDVKRLGNVLDKHWIKRPEEESGQKSLVFTLLTAAGILPDDFNGKKGLIDNFGLSMVRADKPEKETFKIPDDDKKGGSYCLFGGTLALEAFSSLFEDIVKDAANYVEQSNVTSLATMKRRGTNYEEQFTNKFGKKYHDALNSHRTALLEHLALDAFKSSMALDTIRNNLRALQQVDLDPLLLLADKKALMTGFFGAFVQNPELVQSQEQFYNNILTLELHPKKPKDKRTVLDALVEARLFSVHMGVALGPQFGSAADLPAQVSGPVQGPVPPAKTHTAPAAAAPRPLAAPALKTKPAASLADMTIQAPKPKTYTQAHAEIILGNPQYDTIFLLGPSGTAKTGRALAHALMSLQQGHHDAVTMVRGLQNQDTLGYLPGTEGDKLETTFRQLDGNISFLTEGRETRETLRRKNALRTVIPEFTMGETLSSFVIVDDAQMLSETDIEKIRGRREGKDGQRSRIIYTADLSPNQINVADLIEQKSFPGIFPVVNEFAEAVLNEPKSEIAKRTAFICLGTEDVVRNTTSADEALMRENMRHERDALAEIFLDQQTMEYRQRLSVFSKHFQARALEADWKLRTDPQVKAAVKAAHHTHLRQLDQWGDVQAQLTGPFQCPEELKVSNPFSGGMG